MFDNCEICAICIFLCLRMADGTAKPRNIAVVAGNWMAMECRSMNGSHVFMWELERPRAPSLETVFRNHDKIRTLTPKFRSRFGVAMDENCSGFVYTNATQLDDAGRYFCRTDGPTGQDEFSAHLTVLEREPFCETNYTGPNNTTLNQTEGMIVWMQCSVNFRGMWAPTVEWKQHTEGDQQGENGQQIIHSREVSTETVVSSRVTSTHVHICCSIKTTYFSFRMFFQEHNGSLRVTDTNLPNYTYTWESPKLGAQRAQLDDTKEVYVTLHPFEVEQLNTSVGLQKPNGSNVAQVMDTGEVYVTPFIVRKPNGNNDWYTIALILLAAVLIFVTLLNGMGIRRYVRSRRASASCTSSKSPLHCSACHVDKTMIYNASASSTVPIRRLERPSSGEYDLTPTATPNIYDWIGCAEADDDVTFQAMASQNQCDPQMTHCYSSLTLAMTIVSSPYDALDLYEKMDPLISEADLNETEIPERSIQVSKEERYTTPVAKRGFIKSNNLRPSDYMEMNGAKKK